MGSRHNREEAAGRRSRALPPPLPHVPSLTSLTSHHQVAASESRRRRGPRRRRPASPAPGPLRQLERAGAPHSESLRPPALQVASRSPHRPRSHLCLRLRAAGPLTAPPRRLPAAAAARGRGIAVREQFLASESPKRPPGREQPVPAVWATGTL